MGSFSVGDGWMSRQHGSEQIPGAPILQPCWQGLLDISIHHTPKRLVGLALCQLPTHNGLSLGIVCPRA